MTRLAEIKAERDAATSRAETAEFALSLLLNKNVRKVHIRGREGYSATLVGPDRADEGYVIVTWWGAGNQHPTSTPYRTRQYVDMVAAMSKDLSNPEHVAVSELAYKISRAAYAAQQEVV